MRYLAKQTSAYGTKRVLLIEHPQDERYRGCIVSFVAIDKEDGPPDGGQVYEGYTIRELIEEFAADYDIDAGAWEAIPDQLPGCEDGWVAPVRAARDAAGNVLAGQWERLD